jgi:hypothetical protein
MSLFLSLSHPQSLAVSSPYCATATARKREQSVKSRGVVIGCKRRFPRYAVFPKGFATLECSVAHHIVRYFDIIFERITYYCNNAENEHNRLEIQYYVYINK